MTRSATLVAILALLAAAPAGAGPQDPSPQTRVVVELFTSQGCSSCPPADELLRELAKRTDVAALSMHVDYWNYIGWKDPYSSKQMTDRQQGYKKHFHLRFVYTPQIVIDGQAEVVGSRTEAVVELIEQAKRRPHVPIAIADRGDGTSIVRIAAAPYDGPPATVWVAFYDEERTTSVDRGENAGHRIVNANVVRIFRKLGAWQGEAAEFRVVASAHGAGERDGVAIFVQKGEAGEILGAAAGRIKMPVN